MTLNQHTSQTAAVPSVNRRTIPVQFRWREREDDELELGEQPCQLRHSSPTVPALTCLVHPQPWTPRRVLTENSLNSLWRNYDECLIARDGVAMIQSDSCKRRTARTPWPMTAVENYYWISRTTQSLRSHLPVSRATDLDPVPICLRAEPSWE